MAVSLYKAQIPLRQKGQTTCTNHRGRQLDHYCEECNVLICIRCVSTVHKSHPLCDLSEFTIKTKQDIQQFIDNTEKVDLVQIDQYITDTYTQLIDNSSNFEKLSERLKTQTNKLKHDLDLLTAKTLSLYQQMEDDNTKLLQTYKQDLERYSSQLKQQVQECKMALQRGSAIQIYDTGCEIQTTTTLPVQPTLGTASFTTNQNPQGHLEQALGKVTTSNQDQSQGPALHVQSHDRSDGLSSGERSSKLQQRSETKRKTPSTQEGSKGRTEVTSQVLSRTKVLGKWRSPCGITSLCPTTDGRVWICDKENDTCILTFLDRKGEMIREVTHNSHIRDISLSPTTNTLWLCDDWNNIITELVSGQLVHRFSTKDSPRCICITACDHIIMGMNKQISKFTKEGKLVLSSSGTGKPLVWDPCWISECLVTQNVAVADLDSIYNSDKYNPHVVVLDKDFNELFVYSGKVPHTHQPTSQPRSKPFHPCGVAYDSVGNLVIGDGNNNRILLINGRGDFLRIIHTDEYQTRAVCIDREDVLWAVFESDKVKLLQYTKE